MKMIDEYAVDEVMETLVKLSENSGNETIKDGCYECLYWLKAAAENPHNHDYFRILWNVLQNIVEYHGE